MVGKVVLVGNPGVGRTALLERFIGGKGFEFESYVPPENFRKGMRCPSEIKEIATCNSDTPVLLDSELCSLFAFADNTCQCSVWDPDSVKMMTESDSTYRGNMLMHNA